MMKGSPEHRCARERSRVQRRVARAAKRGFTLLELMVVVMLVAILAIIAAPTMSIARNDRIAWDYARQYQQLVHRAHSHAAARGASQLVLFGPGPDARGYARHYEALDSQSLGTTGVPGPNPVSSCRNPLQWLDAMVYPGIVKPSLSAPFLDWVELNSAPNTVNVQMELRTELFIGDPAGQSFAKVDYLAVCITPGGLTYVGGDSSPALALQKMRESPPFNDIAEIQVQRHKGVTGVGLKRRVIIAGSSSPRLKSE
jgi:prepilin-type N-terminal cleavage/methylation domain-containing protein